MKIRHKIIIFILALVMLFTSVQVTAFGVAEIIRDNANQTNNEIYENSAGEYKALQAKKDTYEITYLREESAKHIRMPDGIVMAVQYELPVHFMNDNGEWQNIDNTLIPDSDNYITPDSRLKFNKKTGGNGEVLTIHNGSGKMVFSLINAEKKIPASVTNYELNDGATKLEKLTLVPYITSEIKYRDILPGVDLEYIIVSNNIKENIIVKEKGENYSYTFEIKLNGLTLCENGNGELEIVNESGEKEYFIGAPLMYDSNGAYSESVEYSVIDLGNGKYNFTITADAAWMNDSNRVFPVTIDPPVGVSEIYLEDTYVDSANASTNYADSTVLVVGNTQTSYWKTSQLPELPSNAYIVKSELSFALNLNNDNEAAISARKVTTSWDETITYNDTVSSAPSGSISDEILDFCLIENGDEHVSFDITELVREWYDGYSSNYGIAICREAEYSSSSSVEFASYEYNESDTYVKPSFYVMYKDLKGVEPYWSFTSQNQGFAGAGYINNVTGNLTFIINTLSTTDSLIPTTPTLVYNSEIGGDDVSVLNSIIPHITSSLGYGFRWGMQESVTLRYLYNSEGEQIKCYIYSDSDGTEHYFIPTDEENIYADEDGLLLKLEEFEDEITITDTSQNEKTYTRAASNAFLFPGFILSGISDRYGNTVTWDLNAYGFMENLSVKPKNSTAIEYLDFSYNSSGKIKYIIKESTREAIVFYYSNSPSSITNLSPNSGYYLRKISYIYYDENSSASCVDNFITNGQDANVTIGASAEYAYDINGNLTNVKNDLTDHEIIYTYSNNKVVAVEEKAGSVYGQKITFSYGGTYTEIRSSGSDDVYGTSDDIISRYTFDNEGRTISSYSCDLTGTEIYGAVYGEYEEQENVKNNIKTSVESGGNAVNYVRNGSFETVLSGTIPQFWNKSSGATVTNKIDDWNKYEIRFTPSDNSYDYIYQTVFLPEGEYTLSGTLRTGACDNVSVKLKAESYNNYNHSFEEVIFTSEEYLSSNSDEIVFSTKIDAWNTLDGGESFIIRVEVRGGTNISDEADVRIDDIMLENNAGSSQFSMVQFGSFEYGDQVPATAASDHWDMWDYSNPTIETLSDSSGKVLKITGGFGDESRTAKQIIYRATNAELNSYNAGNLSQLNMDPVSFKVSGFAKGTDQIFNSKSHFALRVDVSYYKGAGNPNEVETFYFEFQDNCTNWQFVSGIVTTRDNEFVRTITIYCEYSNNPGTAYFDNISATWFTGEEKNKNLYYENGLLKASIINDEIVYYEYDEFSNVIKEINTYDSFYEYTYDASGVNLIEEIYYTYTGSLEYDGENIIQNNIVKTPRTKTEYTYNAYGQILETDSYEVEYNAYGDISEIANVQRSSDRQILIPIISALIPDTFTMSHAAIFSPS